MSRLLGLVGVFSLLLGLLTRGAHFAALNHFPRLPTLAIEFGVLFVIASVVHAVLKYEPEESAESS